MMKLDQITFPSVKSHDRGESEENEKLVTMIEAPITCEIVERRLDLQ